MAMNVFGRFMKLDGKGFLSATRVVPTKTKRADLDNFRLLPTETLELWSREGRKYVTLKCRIVRGHHETLDRLNGITTYLKALYKGVS